MTETYTLDDKNEKQSPQKGTEQLKWLQEQEKQAATQVDNRLETLDKQSSVSLQTVEREVQEEKKQKEPPKNEVYVGVSKGMGVGKNGAGASWIGTSEVKDVYSTMRTEVAGKFFKGDVLQTDMYAFMDMDGNPLTSIPFGKVQLSKQIYKGWNIEGIYTFTGKGNNTMQYGISYAGALPEGGYKLKLLPLNHNGNPLDTSFDISLSWNTKVGKNGTINSFLTVNGLDKLPATFYGETEYVHDIAKNLAVFAQARYGKFTQESKVFLSGGVGIRLNIK